MSYPRGTPAQVWECPKCGDYVEAPLLYSEVLCPKVHKVGSKTYQNIGMKVVWAKGDGGDPPSQGKGK